MGEARLNFLRLVGWRVVAAALPGVLALPAMAAQSRFMSFGSEAQCVASHTIPAALCASAFARAKGAFEAKTVAYPTLAQCSKAYGSCAPWPPGARSSFRPVFQGIDIVDTPGEQSVTPASPVRQLRFAALPLAGPAAPPHELTVRGARRAASAAPPPVRGAPPSRAAVGPSGPTPVPPPGSGFKLEDGVLTYPAPERFQPRNLPKVP